MRLQKALKLFGLFFRFVLLSRVELDEVQDTGSLKRTEYFFWHTTQKCFVPDWLYLGVQVDGYLVADMKQVEPFHSGLCTHFTETNAASLPTELHRQQMTELGTKLEDVAGHLAANLINTEAIKEVILSAVSRLCYI